MASNGSLPLHFSSTMQMINSLSGDQNKDAKKKEVALNGTKARKPVNSFVLYRSMMLDLYPQFTQAHRSRLIRQMWNLEQHKTSYSVMARVWTFIRDNSNYGDIRQYLNLAGTICGVVMPETWSGVYNCTIARQPNGNTILIQVALPGPIPPANEIDDSGLLQQLISDGLPLENASQLVTKMNEHQLHIMTVNMRQDFFAQDDTLGEAGRAAVGLTEQMNFNPVATFASVMGLNQNHSIFANGVNVVNVEDITNFDHSLIVSRGPQTHHRFKWDTITAHQAQPQDGAVDFVDIEESVRTYDYDQPNIWTNLVGQMTQAQFEAGELFRD
uniref:Mating type protein MAT1-1-1 n=1 Tax=Cryphonectria parasitica TaxID=5116 RepID=Q96V06_CRYPA|nr:mating type protein MAT1-1-1 [Cryphonectria parasitica]